MTDKPITYAEIWAQVLANRVSAQVLAHLMAKDEVFRAWCIRRKAELERRARDAAQLGTLSDEHYGPTTAVSDEDMA